MIEDSKETEKTTDQEQITLQKQPKYLDCEAQSSLKFSQFEKFQEIISISSDSEEETKSEPKNNDRDLWKFRLPKKSSKYVPQTRKDEESKDNDSWLSKRYPDEFEKNEYQNSEGFYNRKRFWNCSNGVGFDQKIKKDTKEFKTKNISQRSC